MSPRKSGPRPRREAEASRIKTLTEEIAKLRQRLEEAEESLAAIRSGAVDALVVRGHPGDQIFTLKDADRPYRAIIENMRDGALTVRQDGLVLYANKQFAAMLGLPLETVLGSDLFTLVGPQGLPDLQELVRNARQGGAHGEISFTCSSGRPLLVHLSLAPMRIDEIQVLAGVAADITEEKLAQQRIRQMERTEALGRLAGGVAHDLNNLLQPILVNAELLLDETEPGSDQRALLTNVIEAAVRQKDLVRRILSFTRQAKRVLEPVVVTPLVVEAVNLLKPSLPGNIEVRVVADSVSDLVNGDPTELHELVTNLFTNAVDAMEASGGTLEVSLFDITLAQENPKLELKPGRYLKLSFKDTGAGIPPEDLGRIFDPFFTTKSRGRGTGIGLSIVQGIVKGHGGSISVHSRPGQGTEVMVFLPAAGGLRSHAAQATNDWLRGVTTCRILLVDDEGMVLHSMQRALASFGQKPTMVKDAAFALSLFQNLPKYFDLAIIDQNMPKMTGLELAAAMRGINPDIPILLATGYSKAVDDQSLQSAGVTAVVMKPVSLKDLAGAVNLALESRKGASQRRVSE